MHAYTHRRTRTDAHAFTRTHAHARTHACTHARTHIHTHAHTRTHARTHAHTHTRTHTLSRTHTHTHAWEHARIGTCTNALTSTHEKSLVHARTTHTHHSATRARHVRTHTLRERPADCHRPDAESGPSRQSLELAAWAESAIKRESDRARAADAHQRLHLRLTIAKT